MAKSTKRIWRPESWGNDEAYDKIISLMPDPRLEPPSIPKRSIAIISYIDLPGYNKQRAARWSNWKETCREDFQASMKLQEHPGIIYNPRIHIVAQVGSKSPDDISIVERYKFQIDMLQPLKIDSRDRRTGCLGLIENDSVLKREHVKVTEIVSRKKDSEGFTHRWVALFIWGVSE